MPLMYASRNPGAMAPQFTSYGLNPNVGTGTFSLAVCTSSINACCSGVTDGAVPVCGRPGTGAGVGAGAGAGAW